jgi:hypothetical protein
MSVCVRGVRPNPAIEWIPDGIAGPVLRIGQQIVDAFADHELGLTRGEEVEVAVQESHEEYVRGVAEETDRLLSERFLQRWNARTIKYNAKSAFIPTALSDDIDRRFDHDFDWDVSNGRRQR